MTDNEKHIAIEPEPNTHRLVMESAPGHVLLMARGSEFFCRAYLDRYLESNTIPPMHTLLVLAVLDARPGAFPIDVLGETR